MAAAAAAVPACVVAAFAAAAAAPLSPDEAAAAATEAACPIKSTSNSFSLTLLNGMRRCHAPKMMNGTAVLAYNKLQSQMKMPVLGPIKACPLNAL